MLRKAKAVLTILKDPYGDAEPPRMNSSVRPRVIMLTPLLIAVLSEVWADGQGGPQ